MIFERNLGYFLIIASVGVIAAVMMSWLTPLALIVAAVMFAGGYGFVRQVRIESELIKGNSSLH